jgi:capsular exopolysaccharide synthesis family protein
LRYATPQFNVTAKVLVNGANGRKTTSGISEVSLLSELGLFSDQNDVNNELQIIRSRTIIEKTVNDLQLNVTYWGQGEVRYAETYKKSPFFIDLLSLKKQLEYPIQYDIRITKDKVKFIDKETDSSFSANFGDTLNFRYGSWVLLQNPEVIEKDPHHELGMKIITYGAAFTQYSNLITAIITNENVTTIDLGYSATVPSKGEDVLNYLINLYVNSNIEENNKIADSTIAFIESRLVGVGQELGTVEKGIEQFKKANKLADIGEQSKALVTTSADLEKTLAEQQVQIEVIDGLEKYLEDDKNNARIMPTSAPIQDPAFVAVLEKYNAMQLQRQQYLLNSTEENPAVKSLDLQLAQQRADLLKILRSFKNGLIVNRANLESRSGTLAGAIQKVPTQERQYLDFSRRQNVLQQLYLYLLQTREQTAVSKYNNIAPIRIIDAPQSAPQPYSPNKIIVGIVALFFGLAIPSGVLFTKELLNTKIITAADITSVTHVPVVAEISHSKSAKTVVVTRESRSAVAEQFRSLRTNLQYLLHGKNEKVILLTSSMSGEGKSFVALNLASALSLSGKKVLLVELDLRKPKLSQNLNLDNFTGITNYLVSDITINDIIRPSGLHPDCYIVSSGSLPPNPSELILSERIEKLFEEARKSFDFIIVDTPPVGLVTDAQLLDRYSDLTLYIVRQKFTFKKQIQIIEDLYYTRKMRKLNIVMNDVKKTPGYNSGYGYGYGYGLGYYDDDRKNKKFFKRIFSAKSV